MFTAMQLIGLALVIVGAFLAAGVPGAIIGAGIMFTYFGLAGER